MWLSKTADYILRPIQSLSWVLSRIGAGILALLMFLTATDVCLRYLFNQPIIWAYEVTELLLVFVVFFWVAHAAILKAHVTVDMIVSRFTPRTQSIVDTITSFLGLCIFSLVAWQSVIMAQRHWVSGLVTVTADIPVFPFTLVLAFGCTLLSLVMLTNILKSIAKVIGE